MNNSNKALSTILLTVFTGNFAYSTPSDFMDMSLEDLMNVKISVASHFETTADMASHSVETIDRKSWELFGARNSHEALQYQSGMVSIPSLFGSHGLSIRGYADGTNIRSNSTLLDGIPLNGFQLSGSNYFTPHIGLGIVDRIELIKGAASAKYGTEAFHGVISYKTYETEEDEVQSYISLGSFDAKKVYVNGHKNFSNNLKLDIAVDYNEVENQKLDYFKHEDGSVEGQFANGWENLSILTKLRTNYGKNKFKLSFYHFDHSFNDAHGFSAFATQYNQGFQRGRTISNAYSLKHNIDFNKKYSLQSKLYRTTFYNNYAELTSFTTRVSPGEYPSATTQHQNYRTERNGLSILLKKNRLSSNIEYSLEYNYDGFKIPEAIGKSSGSSTYFREVVEGTKRNIHGISLLTNYYLGENFKFVLGGRYDDYSDIDSHFSPKAAAIYSKDKNVFKLIYGHAYKAPSSNEIRGFTNTAQPNFSLDPSVLDTYEAVYIRKEKSMSFKNTLFYSYYKNGITLGGSPLIYSNTTKGKSYGVESEIRHKYKALENTFNLSYIRSFAITDANREYRAFPRVISNLTSKYFLSSIESSIFLGVRHMGSMKGSPPKASLSDEDEIPDYLRFDLGISKEGHSFDYGFNVKNIFDKENRVPTPWASRFGSDEHGVAMQLWLKYKI